MVCAPANTTKAAISKAARDSIPTEDALLPVLSLISMATLLALYYFHGSSARAGDNDLEPATAAAPSS